jgi:uncharacterized membrane protein YbjE (DUF340 family)
MTINVTYVLVILVGLYFGITTYINTKHQMILWGLWILLFSLGLELRWINEGNYLMDTTDIFWTLRDILRTIIMIIWFQLAYKIKK